MAMGMPIVTFDLAEARFSARDAALYATPNLVEDFASKIEILLDDQDLRLKLGAVGRENVEKSFNWENEQENLLRAYQRLFPKNCNSTASDPIELSN